MLFNLNYNYKYFKMSILIRIKIKLIFLFIRLGKKPFKIQKKEKIMIRILIITLRKFLIII